MLLTKTQVPQFIQIQNIEGNAHSSIENNSKVTVCEFPGFNESLLYTALSQNKVYGYSTTREIKTALYNALPNASIIGMQFVHVSGEIGKLILMEKIPIEDGHYYYLVSASLENRKFQEEARIRLHWPPSNEENHGSEYSTINSLSTDRLLTGFSGNKVLEVFSLKPFSRQDMHLELGFELKCFVTLNSTKPPLLVVSPLRASELRVMRVKSPRNTLYLEPLRTIAMAEGELLQILWLPRHELLLTANANRATIRGWKVKGGGECIDLGLLHEDREESAISCWDSFGEGIAAYYASRNSLHICQLEYDI